MENLGKNIGAHIYRLKDVNLWDNIGKNAHGKFAIASYDLLTDFGDNIGINIFHTIGQSIKSKAHKS